jgi:hypothetical protein
MSVADKASYVSRFLVKLFEIFAAGIATAVGGYLVAHLSGFWPTSPLPSAVSPTPAVVHVAPAPGPNTTSNTTSSTASSAGEMSSEARKTSRAQPAAAPAEASPQRSAAPAPVQQDATAAPAPRPVANAPQAAPSRKHAETTNPPSSKAREDESVEARVRAALANVDANRPSAPDVQPRKADVTPSLPAVEMPQPRPAEAPSTTAAVPPSRSADLQPPGSQQPISAQPLVQQPPAQAVVPAQSEPLTTVEIKSRPVADVSTLAPPEPAPPANEEKGILSTIKHILPDFRRPEGDDAPRPPMPVGSQ